MITGLSNAVNEIQQKYFELLVAAVPKTKRIGVLQDSSTLAADSRARNKEAVKRWATQNAVEVHYEDVAAPEDIEHAVGRLAKQSMQALVVLPSAMLGAEAPRVAKLAMTQRWPVISGSTRQPESGWLLSYSADNSANFRRAAHYVDRILKGAKPGDLPIERPMTFDLVINLKSAKALGLTMPPEIMVRATRVIE
jgi:putative ABC transport system substrate-binding protein